MEAIACMRSSCSYTTCKRSRQAVRASTQRIVDGSRSGAAERKAARTQGVPSVPAAPAGGLSFWRMSAVTGSCVALLLSAADASTASVAANIQSYPRTPNAVYELASDLPGRSSPLETLQRAEQELPKYELGGAKQPTDALTEAVSDYTGAARDQLEALKNTLQGGAQDAAGSAADAAQNVVEESTDKATQQFTSLKGGADSIKSTVQDKAAEAKDTVQDKLDEGKSQTSGFLNLFKKKAGQVRDTVQGSLPSSQGQGYLVSAQPPPAGESAIAPRTVQGTVRGAGAEGKDNVTAVEPVAETVQNFFGSIQEKVDQIKAENAQGAAPELMSRVQGRGMWVAAKGGEFLKNKAAQVGDRAKQGVNEAQGLADQAKSNVMDQAGQAKRGLFGGIRSNVEKLKGKDQSMVFDVNGGRQMYVAFGQGGEFLKNKASEAGERVKQGAQSVQGAVTGFADDATSNLRSGTDNIKGQADRAVSGAQRGADDLSGKVQDIPAAIRDNVSFRFEQGSGGRGMMVAARGGEFLKNKASQAGEQAKQGVSAVQGAVTDFADDATRNLRAGADKIKGQADSAVSGVQRGADDLSSKVQDIPATVQDNVSFRFEQGNEHGMLVAAQGGDFLKSKAAQAGERAKQGAQSAQGAIQSFTDEASSNLRQGADQLMGKANGAASGVQQRADEFNDKANFQSFTDEASSNLRQGADQLMGKASGAASGVQQRADEFKEKANFQDIPGTVQDNLSGTVQDSLSGVKSNLGEQADQLKDKVKGVLTNVVDTRADDANGNPVEASGLDKDTAAEEQAEGLKTQLAAVKSMLGM